MLTDAQQHAANRFSKSLLALSDDALIDTYHQAAEDYGSAASANPPNHAFKAAAAVDEPRGEPRPTSVLFRPQTAPCAPARSSTRGERICAPAKASPFP